jgi:hypothetical protein
MKRAVAGVVTIALMALLLWSGTRRQGAPAPVEELPRLETQTAATGAAEARIHGLLASAARGDVSAYLDAFTGPLRDRLAREVEERGRDVFAADLATASRARKSHAVFAAEPLGPDAASVAVEAVYLDRNERQTYHVEKSGAVWLVSGVESLKSRPPSSRFGAPAVYVAPEGVPVPGGVSVETGDDG